MCAVLTSSRGMSRVKDYLPLEVSKYFELVSGILAERRAMVIEIFIILLVIVFKSFLFNFDKFPNSFLYKAPLAIDNF